MNHMIFQPFGEKKKMHVSFDTRTRFYRDGKPGYLKDIPRTLGYVLDVSARYTELTDLYALLRDIDGRELEIETSPA